MDTATKSTKRLKLTNANKVPALTVVEVPVLLESIISFIPSIETHKEHQASEVPVVVRTIVALCRAIPGLGKRMDPINEAWWRQLILGRFDFSTDSRVFNTCDWTGERWEELSDLSDDEEDGDWHRQPWNGPIDEWKNEHRSLRWPTHAYFRPAAYEFLEKIQQDQALMSTLWPEEEDAYTVFCDLLLLLRFRSTPERRFFTVVDGTDEHESQPCLMGRFPTQIVGKGFAMLKFCGFAPQYWYIDYWRAKFDPVSPRWSGFKRKRLPVVCECLNKYDCRVCRNDDACLFPRTRVSTGYPTSDLRRLVHKTFDDWRRIELFDEMLYAPIYHIGRTKASGRWLGFVGRLDACESPQCAGNHGRVSVWMPT